MRWRLRDAATHAGRLALLVIVVLAAFSCRRKPAVRPNDARATTQSQVRKAPPQFRDPKELAKVFIHALFEDPRLALSLFESNYRNSVTEEQFRSLLKTMLPPAGTIASLKYIAFEDGFRESDGVVSMSCSYKVLSSDNSKPASKVEIDMVKSCDTHRVRRFSVSQMPR